MRTPEQIKAHYQIERYLADQLRNASATDRPRLYSSLYNELFRQVPELVTPEQDFVKERLTREIRTIKKWIDHNTVFLEIGPGDCRLSIKVAELVKQVFAVDVSSEITNRIKLPVNVSLILSDGCSIPVPENSIGVAYSHQLMEHLHPDDALVQLQNIFRALLPGGVYLCLTPNRISGPHDISMYFDEVATGFHLREYTSIELVQIFRKTGFSDIVVYIGLKGYSIGCPLTVVKYLEKVLVKFPHFLRKKVRGYPLNCIFISGKKSR